MAMRLCKNYIFSVLLWSGALALNSSAKAEMVFAPVSIVLDYSNRVGVYPWKVTHWSSASFSDMSACEDWLITEALNDGFTARKVSSGIVFEKASSGKIFVPQQIRCIGIFILPEN